MLLVSTINGTTGPERAAGEATLAIAAAAGYVFLAVTSAAGGGPEYPIGAPLLGRAEK